MLINGLPTWKPRIVGLVTRNHHHASVRKAITCCMGDSFIHVSNNIASRPHMYLNLWLSHADIKGTRYKNLGAIWGLWFPFWFLGSKITNIWHQLFLISVVNKWHDKRKLKEKKPPLIHPMYHFKSINSPILHGIFPLKILDRLIQLDLWHYSNTKSRQL